MFIEKWWGEYFGGTDDSYTLMDYFNKDAKEEYCLANIFSDFNLDDNKPFDGFRDTEDIRFYNEDGIFHQDIDVAIDFLLDIAAITLESLHSGSVTLKDLDSSNSDKTIIIVAQSNTLNYLIGILRDFTENSSAYDLAEMCGEDDMLEIARQCKEIINELENYL